MLSNLSNNLGTYLADVAASYLREDVTGWEVSLTADILLPLLALED